MERLVMERLLNVTTVVAVILLLIVLFSVRRAHIRAEYSVTWLGAAFTMLVLSRFRGAMDAMARVVGLPGDSPLALFLIVGSVFLILFFRFSVIVSNLRDDNIDLAQRVAILEYYIQSLREQG